MSERDCGQSKRVKRASMWTEQGSEMSVALWSAAERVSGVHGASDMCESSEQPSGPFKTRLSLTRNALLMIFQLSHEKVSEVIEQARDQKTENRPRVFSSECRLLWFITDNKEKDQSVTRYFFFFIWFQNAKNPIKTLIK